MDEERLNCGHTEEEHVERLTLIAQAVSEGDFTPLLAYLSNDALGAALQGAIMEVFIRTQDDDVAEHNWISFKAMVDDTFFSEESDHPEMKQYVLEQREKFSAAVEQTTFEEEAAAGLEKLFEHGVPDDDDWPGQYL